MDALEAKNIVETSNFHKGWRAAINYVLGSLRSFPHGGGDKAIMAEVDRLIAEAVNALPNLITENEKLLGALERSNASANRRGAENERLRAALKTIEAALIQSHTKDS